MSHSNSSLNCFVNCMAKYEHTYILHTPILEPVSPHLVFGSMAHEVLEKAGNLRDLNELGLLTDDEIETVIPSEVIGQELKEFFNIPNWHKYFVGVVKQVAKYEKELCEDFEKEFGEKCVIHRELKLQMTPEEIFNSYHIHGVHQPLVGVIDLLLVGKKGAYILDYKFSKNSKTQADFDLNSQLPLYAHFVNKEFNVPLRNIKVGYIDIPKQSFDMPNLLSNGTISRSKSQNVSAEMYELAVKAVHGDDPYYNCEPGGYYYDAYCNFLNNKAAYLNVQWLDVEASNYILQDILLTAQTVDRMIENKEAFLHKYDSYSCSNCEYKYKCKPWTTVEDKCDVGN